MPRLTHLIKAEVKHVPEYTSSLLESRYSSMQCSTGLVCYCRKYTSRLAKLLGGRVPSASLSILTTLAQYPKVLTLGSRDQ